MYRCIILVLTFTTPVLEKKWHVVIQVSSPSASTAAEAVLVAVNQKSSVNNLIKRGQEFGGVHA